MEQQQVMPDLYMYSVWAKYFVSGASLYEISLAYSVSEDLLFG